MEKMFFGIGRPIRQQEGPGETGIERWLSLVGMIENDPEKGF